VITTSTRADNTSIDAIATTANIISNVELL
jgi:hypothetical protein